MKRVNLVFGLVLLFSFLTYLLVGGSGFNHSSSVFSATYDGTCDSSADYGNTRCVSGMVQVCTGLGWNTTSYCPNGTVCDGASCVSVDAGDVGYKDCVCDGDFWCCTEYTATEDLGEMCWRDEECAQMNHTECDTNSDCEDLYIDKQCCGSDNLCRVCSSGGGGSSSPTPTLTSCTLVNGVCSTTTPGVCSTGTPSGADTEKTSTGMDYVWTCLGSCGGSPASCKTHVCDNDPNYHKTNGACKSVATLDDVSNKTLCVSGDEDSVSTTETEITWNCLGSTGKCAEESGDDALNCSSAINQDNWFQVNDGNIVAKGRVANYVPVTAVDKNGNSSSTVNNGLVYSKTEISLPDRDKSKGEGKTDSDFSIKTYSYTKLKTDYFGRDGVGTEMEESTENWSKIKETTGVIFVNGDLEISDDLVTTNFVMIIADGKITINSDVNEVDAILVASSVTAESDDECSDSQLVINGMVHAYGTGGVNFKRSLCEIDDGAGNLVYQNNTLPSVVVNYKPELLFMVPTELSKAFSQWKIN